jgi:hypothetical protein
MQGWEGVAKTNPLFPPCHSPTVNSGRRVIHQVHLSLDRKFGCREAVLDCRSEVPAVHAGECRHGKLSRAFEQHRRRPTVPSEIERDNELIANPCQGDPPGIRIKLRGLQVIHVRDVRNRDGITGFDGPTEADMRVKEHIIIDEHRGPLVRWKDNERLRDVCSREL